MEILQLKYFIESAKNENFSKTANRYLVPPSSVSSSIKKLETELGCRLFDRNSNKITLNKQGEEFFDSANTALNLLEEAKAKLKYQNGDMKQEISLLVRSERSFINKKLLAFKKLYPHSVVHFTHSYLPINHKEYDIIIDALSEEYKGYTASPLITEKIKIAASPKNSISNKRLTLRNLKNQQFITMSCGSSLNKITKDVCHKAGFSPNIIVESDDPHYLRNYIREDFGIAFYPETSWKDNLDKDIVFLDVVDFDFSRTTYIYLNNEKTVMPAAKALFDYIIG